MWKKVHAIREIDGKYFPPIYPALARRAGISGQVIVKVLIGADGKIEDVRLVRSVPMLDQAAMDAAWQMIFSPGEQRLIPVRVWMTVPFNFRLK